MNIDQIMWYQGRPKGRILKENGEFFRDTELNYDVITSGLMPHNVDPDEEEKLKKLLEDKVNSKRSTEKHLYDVVFGVVRNHLKVDLKGTTADVNQVQLCIRYNGKLYSGMSDLALNIAFAVEADGLEAEAEKFVSIMRSNHANVFAREKEGF